MPEDGDSSGDRPTMLQVAWSGKRRKAGRARIFAKQKHGKHENRVLSAIDCLIRAVDRAVPAVNNKKTFLVLDRE